MTEWECVLGVGKVTCRSFTPKGDGEVERQGSSWVDDKSDLDDVSITCEDGKVDVEHVLMRSGERFSR